VETYHVRGLGALREEVDGALSRSLKDGTKKSYNSAVRNWARFCITHDTSIVLCVGEPGYDSARDIEEIFTYFLVWCCRTMEVASADKNCTAVATWCLHMFGHRPKYRKDLFGAAKRGLLRIHWKCPSRKKPVRAEHLEAIFDWMDKSSYRMHCLFTAFTCPWHALLRKSEFTMRNAGRGFNPIVDVTWGKVNWFPNALKPETVEIELGICKGDQRRPTSVYLHRSENVKICPVRALHKLFWWHGKPRRKNDPVFVWEDVPLKPSVFTRLFKRVLLIACKVNDLVPHSLRVGGAQALQEAGSPPWAVQAIGRWSSSCPFRVYCHGDFRAVASWAKKMASWRSNRHEYRNERR